MPEAHSVTRARVHLLTAWTLALGLAAAGEDAVYCPVAKPDPAPEVLKLTFGGPEVKFSEQQQELRALANSPHDPKVERALRWMIHQVDLPFELRDEALMTLGNWRMAWMVEDVAGMMEEPRQPEKWRANMTRHLAMFHMTYLDDDSYKALEKAAASNDLPVRIKALENVAFVCSEYRFERTNPERYQKVLSLVGLALEHADEGVVTAGCKAAGTAELAPKAADLEKLAADEKRGAPLRIEALLALRPLARVESLPAVEACAKAADETLKQAAEDLRSYVFLAQLSSNDKALQAQAYADLAGLGAKARNALLRGMRFPEHAGYPYVRSLLAKVMIAEQGMALLDRADFWNLGGDRKKPGTGNPKVQVQQDKRLIAIEGECVLEAGPLEYAVVCKGENAKLHETVLGLNTDPMQVTYALLACNYTYAGELGEAGKVNLPKGAGVMLSVEYEWTEVAPQGEKTQWVRVPLETMIWNSHTLAPMRRVPWVFTGSKMVKDPNTGKDVLMVVLERSIVAIMPDENALLNNILDEAERANVGQERAGAFYEVNRAIVPKKGAFCRLIFEPWSGEKLKPEDLKDTAEAPEQAPERP
ncbi:MAG: YdjY domain-containing protein [Planctomycetota bacterium]|nr:YdjY domain-containing protein [Planctomycetota bacterium]